MRDRIRSRGVPVFGPLDHGLCHSIYFAGPENLTLEVATSDQVEHPLDNQGMWIDPEVVELAGISSEELQKFVQPASMQDRAAPSNNQSLIRRSHTSLTRKRRIR